MAFYFECLNGGNQGTRNLPLGIIPHVHVFTDTLPEDERDIDRWNPVPFPEKRPDNFPVTRLGYVIPTKEVVIGDKRIIINGFLPGFATRAPQLEIGIEHFIFTRHKLLEVILPDEERWFHGYIKYLEGKV